MHKETGTNTAVYWEFLGYFPVLPLRIPSRKQSNVFCHVTYWLCMQSGGQGKGGGVWLKGAGWPELSAACTYYPSSRPSNFLVAPTSLCYSIAKYYIAQSCKIFPIFFSRHLKWESCIPPFLLMPRVCNSWCLYSQVLPPCHAPPPLQNCLSNINKLIS